ncbi:Lipocalin-like domain-containing protein [Spirosomataceae bacterium TFI 002]|nr:Lipocalin-like domain-containing protein [Spirosomataceae bacterium TFI 002]
MYSKFSPLYILFAFVLFFSSCSSDDVSPVSLEGTWNLTAADVTFDDVVISATAKGLQENFISSKSFTFNGDMSVTSLDSHGDASISGTYTFDNSTNKLVINEVYEGENYVYNYDVNLNGNTLELKSITIDLTKEYDFEDEEEIGLAFEIFSLLEDQEDDLIIKVNPDAKTVFVTYKFAK